MKLKSKKIYDKSYSYYLTHRSYVIPAILLCLSLLCLAYIASIGQFTRPMTDDYLFMSIDGAENRSFQFGINGRYTTALVYGLGYSIPGFLKIVPVVSILIVLVGIYTVLSTYFLKYFIIRYAKLVMITIASITTLAICLILPGLYASFFWFSSAPVHVWSFGLLLLYLSYIGSSHLKNHLPIRLLTVGIIGFLLSMMNETVTALIFVFSAVSIVLALKAKANIKRRLSEATIGALASLAALIVLFFSPGAMSRRNAVAQANESGLVDRLSNLPSVLTESLFYQIPLLINNGWVLLGVVVFGVFISYFYIKNIGVSKIKKICVILLSLIFVYIAVIFANISVIYIGSGASAPPIRAHFITSLMLVFICFTVGIFIGLMLNIYKLPSRVICASLAISAICLLVVTGVPTISYVQEQKHRHYVHAELWDNRDKIIRTSNAKNECPVRVQSLPLPDVADIQPNPKTWTNLWLSDYYSSTKKTCSVIGY